MRSKPCRVCDEVKPVAAFAIDWRNSDGHDNRCRSCEAARTSRKHRVQIQATA